MLKYTCRKKNMIHSNTKYFFSSCKKKKKKKIKKKVFNNRNSLNSYGIVAVNQGILV